MVSKIEWLYCAITLVSGILIHCPQILFWITDSTLRTCLICIWVMQILVLKVNLSLCDGHSVDIFLYIRFNSHYLWWIETNKWNDSTFSQHSIFSVCTLWIIILNQIVSFIRVLWGHNRCNMCENIDGLWASRITVL